MDNILLILDGNIAKEFLNRVYNNPILDNSYKVIYYDDNLVSEDRMKLDNFKFFKFDPTSAVKISNILQRIDFKHISIVMATKTDTNEVFQNIRFINKNISITILDSWNLGINDTNTDIISSQELLANRAFDTLPNVPLVGQNIGLGIGEVLQVRVPFGSSFVYRKVSHLEQKEWKISAIYRNHQLIVPNKQTTIAPNDQLLLVGNPNLLKSIYSQIVNEKGNSLLKYGNNIYCLVDMNIDTKSSILKLFQSIKYINKNLKGGKIYIRVLNPQNIKLLKIIKKFNEESNIDLVLIYKRSNIEEIFSKDFINLGIGLLMISNELFANTKIRKLIGGLKIAIIKVGKKSIQNANEIIIAMTEDKKYQSISNVVFDLASQLDKNITIYDLIPEQKENKNINHYQQMGKVFSKDINKISSNKNPIRRLKEIDNFIQVLPHTQEITNSSKLNSLLSTDIEQLYHKLDDYTQIFIYQEL
jgi:hypothetical protein